MEVMVQILGFRFQIVNRGRNSLRYPGITDNHLTDNNHTEDDALEHNGDNSPAWRLEVRV